MPEHRPTRDDALYMWIINRPYGVSEKEARNGFLSWLAEEMATGWDEGAHRVYASNLDESEWTAQDWATENPYRKDNA